MPLPVLCRPSRYRGPPMTHASTATVEPRFAEGDFRVGRVLSRAISVLLRHFLTFFIVTFVAFLPLILLQQATANAERDPAQALAMLGVTLGLVVLMIMLSMLSSAVILHAAFQDMRNRPVNLAESLKVGLSGFLPLMLLSPVAAAPLVLSSTLQIIPVLILSLIFFTRWFVAVPACVVERLRLGKSLLRSRDLTKGHRGKIFGLVLLLLLLGLLVPLLELALSAVGGESSVVVGDLISTSIVGTTSSVIIAVTYHDLRAAKEGIDIEQIA